MIICYFNEQGFCIEGSLGEVRLTYDTPESVEHDLYSFRWLVFNEMLEQLKELGHPGPGEELLLYTDSRLVEELNGELKTDNKFASASRLYYISHDLPKFRRVRIEKCPSATVRRKLNESLSSSRH